MVIIFASQLRASEKHTCIKTPSSQSLPSQESHRRPSPSTVSPYNNICHTRSIQMRAVHNRDLSLDRSKTPRPKSPQRSEGGTAAPAGGHAERPSTTPPSRVAALGTSELHDLRQPLHARSLDTFQNPPEELLELYAHPIYISGNASRTRLSNMSESRWSQPSSEQKRPSSRGRSHSTSTNPSRRQPPRQSFQAPPAQPAPLYSPSLPPLESVSSSASSPFGGVPAYTPASLPYGQHASFVGQYTMSPQPASMPQYAYTHHPGLHVQDTSMHAPQNQLLRYNANALVHMMQPPTPVFQGYPGHPQEASPSSSHSHSFPFPNNSGRSAMFSQPQAHSPPSQSSAHASPPPHSPLVAQGSGPPLQMHSSPHSPSYAGQATYGPLRYPTPPFPYPQQSYTPSPSIYAPRFAPSPYPPHSFTAEPGQEASLGTWWYLPPAHSSAQYDSFQSAYPMSFSMRPRVMEAYPQPGPSSLPSPLYPMSPRQQPVPYSPSHPLPPAARDPPPPIQYPGRPPSFSSAVLRQQLSEADPPAPDCPADDCPADDCPADDCPATDCPAADPPAASSSRPATDRSRRQQHANPPAQRSEWVMWVGNVPSDATHDELWRFLNQEPTAGSAAAKDHWGGVLSIFLISRSNCAFVNFQSEANLLAAIQHFNGQPLRPNDPRCPRLVCRVRGRDDDLKAGVGGQRSAGLHVRWIRGQKGKARSQALARGQQLRSASTSSERAMTPGSSPSDPPPIHASLSLSSDEEGHRSHRPRPQPHSSSSQSGSGSGSYASTSSSILTQHFPKRYFILKSLTQKDLDISVEKGLWATQRHNEATLDQAYRTSKEVYLIFGVNKSGEFYGCARMAGPISRGEHRVSWASRTDSPPQRRMSRSSASSSPPVSRRNTHTFFSPQEMRYEESPLPVSPDKSLPLSQPKSQSTSAVPESSQRRDAEGATPEEAVALARLHLSTPPDLQDAHRQLTILTPVGRGQSVDNVGPVPQPAIELDPTAPTRHMRHKSAPTESSSVREDQHARRLDLGSLSDTPLDTVAEEEEKLGEEKAEQATRGAGAGPERETKDGQSWGEPFKVQWIRTERLPFYRTRHLRNPWNHDREVKVSRDGTELEPSVGQALLDEWDRPAPQPPPPGAASPATERRQGGRAACEKGGAGEEPPEKGG